MKLNDLIPSDKLNALEKAIYKKSGLNVSVFDEEGNVISSYNEWANKLCPVIKGNEKSKNVICTNANNNISMMARNSKKPVTEECDAGLLKFSVPVFADENFLGTISGCGLLPEDEGCEVDTFLLNKLAGLDENEAKELSKDIKTISTENVDSVIRFIQDELSRLTK
ncbi:MAG: PocR ligand-binding domain-containing protein [Spirochaetes bacterium]|nr:PocR ligand-binding domain-containing protein [Spirochaetota bacterium]